MDQNLVKKQKIASIILKFYDRLKILNKKQHAIINTIVTKNNTSNERTIAK